MIFTEQRLLQLNKFGQGLISLEIILDDFQTFSRADKKLYLDDLIYLIVQSKPENQDIILASNESKFALQTHQINSNAKKFNRDFLENMLELSENEQDNIAKFLLTLFKIAYFRRFQTEKNHPHKWWYQDFAIQNEHQELTVLSKNG